MIVVVGLSHRTAPIAVRELLAISSDSAAELLGELLANPSVGEAMLLSTCNRVELIVAGRGDTPDLETVRHAAYELLVSRSPKTAPHLYKRTGAEAVRHLFRVAASLDSLVLGEPQILGQLKDSFELARKNGTLGPQLNRAVPRAIRAAKRVRTETAIGSGLVSVPSVAVDLSRQIFGELSGKSALLVGSGEMAESVARLLRNEGAKLFVSGRNQTRAAELAQTFGGKARSFSELEATLSEADVVISSTSAPGFVIDHEMVARSRRARRQRTAFFIDLAVPRDVEPSVERLSGVFLYNIDDFERVVAESLSGRQREAEQAEQIVADEARGWERWAEEAQATPTIVALRVQFRAVLEGELDKSLKGRLKHLGSEERKALATMIEAALKKLLHGPTVRLRGAASDPLASDSERLERLAAALNELFAPDLLAAVESEADADEEAISGDGRVPAPRAASDR